MAGACRVSFCIKPPMLVLSDPHPQLLPPSTGTTWSSNPFTSRTLPQQESSRSSLIRQPLLLQSPPSLPTACSAPPPKTPNTIHSPLNHFYNSGINYSLPASETIVNRSPPSSAVPCTPVPSPTHRARTCEHRSFPQLQPHLTSTVPSPATATNSSTLITQHPHSFSPWYAAAQPSTPPPLQYLRMQANGVCRLPSSPGSACFSSRPPFLSTTRCGRSSWYAYMRK